VLFLALFASQAGILTLAPILSDVAADFDISIAEAGQLRILAAPLAALVAIAAGRALVRFSPRASRRRERLLARFDCERGRTDVHLLAARRSRHGQESRP
jgi:predicted MFS family arabinose efflux permease